MPLCDALHVSIPDLLVTPAVLGESPTVFGLFNIF